MIRRIVRIWACSSAVLGIAATALAQVSFEPRPLRSMPLQVEVTACDTATPPVCTQPPDLIVELNRRFRQGDWSGAQSVGIDMLARTQAAAGGQSRPEFNPFTSYIWVTWIGPDSFGADRLNRMLVHSPATEPFSLHLTGQRTIYEIYVSRSEHAEIASRFTSTAKLDPALAQIPDVVAKVVPVVFGLFGATAGVLLSAPPPPAPKTGLPAPPPPPKTVFWAMPFRIDLPDRRAAIAVRTVARDRVSADEFEEAADRLSVDMSFRREICPRELAVAQLTAVKGAHRAGCGGSAEACLAAIDAALRSTFTERSGSAACLANSDGMTTVDTAVRTFAREHLGREVTVDMTFNNAPLQRISFGLVEAVAIGAKLYDPRVKLTDGTIRADPMPRLLTIVTVNRSLRGYDPGTVSPSAAEKQRLFFGAVIVPDFGLAGGYSYLPMRGLSLNVGGALLLTKSAPENAIGKEPAKATDPFEIGKGLAGFVGVGYAFK